MAIMLAKTYQALKAAGAPEADAIAAAEELAAYENRVTNIENRLDRIENRLDHIENRLDHIENQLAVVEAKVAELVGKITVLTWAVGINAAATIAILGVLLRGH
jgi:chromosome segregation ATPase